MRLEQIFAPDTRMAMAQIQSHFGEDSMVVSNRRYNGRNELIAAVDNLTKAATAVASAPTPSVSAPTPVISAPTPAPALVTEQQRALTLVELIKAEFQTSRLEMQSLTRLPHQAHATPTHIIELQSLFLDTGMSARLSLQMHDPLAPTKKLQDGLKALTQWMKTQIKAYDLVADPAQAHLIAGHPGSGKSTMIARIARQLAMADESRKIAIISFNDDRIGAWQATQVAGARAGAETYRVLSVKQLQALYAEIGESHHLLIDTAGADIQTEVRCITKIIPGLKSHLMLAADTNETSALTLLGHTDLHWTSCMVSRLDGIDYPWAIISILINGKIPVSLGSFCTDMTSPPRVLSGDFLAHLIVKKIQRHIDSILTPSEDTDAPGHIDNPGLKEYTHEQLNFG